MTGGTNYLTNFTFSNNKAAAGGAICVDGGTLYLRNSIVWGNTSDNISGTVTHSYNLLQGGTVTTGVATIVANTDPLFADAAKGDYSLQPESPAIDLGDSTVYNFGKTPDISAIKTDFAGNTRIQAYNIDLGAYEAIIPIVPAVGIVYVKEGGAGKADGSSWDDAYPNLAYPLHMAKIYGITQIWVAEGVYYPIY